MKSGCFSKPLRRWKKRAICGEETRARKLLGSSNERKDCRVSRMGFHHDLHRCYHDRNDAPLVCPPPRPILKRVGLFRALVGRPRIPSPRRIPLESGSAPSSLSAACRDPSLSACLVVDCPRPVPSPRWPRPAPRPPTPPKMVRCCSVREYWLLGKIRNCGN